MNPSFSPIRFKTVLAAAIVLAAFSFGNAAFAQAKGMDDPFRAPYKKALQGKTVVFVPLAMGMDIAQGWLEGMKKDLEPHGVKVTARDPNWNTSAGAQAITTLISEKPDVLVVHNPDVQTYAKLLQKAEEAGIQVVQINMRSAYQTVVFVGGDYVDIGEQETAAVVESCKGKSNKIAIVQGAPSSSASAYMSRGVQNVLAKHPEVKVVSNQAADWDAAKAKGITQTVLKQNPDLCGIVGFWDTQDTGTAAAIKEAGLTGKVFLATEGAGEQKGGCDQVKAGVFDFYVNFDVPTQASNMASSIKWLLQNKGKTGGAKGSIYSTLRHITKANASVDGTCWKLGKI